MLRSVREVSILVNIDAGAKPGKGEEGWPSMGQRVREGEEGRGKEGQEECGYEVGLDALEAAQRDRVPNVDVLEDLLLDAHDLRDER